MEKIRNFFRLFGDHIMISLFFVGIFIMYIGCCQNFFNEKINELIFELGKIISISGVTAFLLKLSQYKNVYRKALEEIIYSETFLGKRSDLENIWKNVSRALFQYKFPELHSDLFQIVSEKYFPKNRVSYYTDIKQYLFIKWKDKDAEVLEIEEKIDLIVHTSTKSRTPYKTTYQVPVPPGTNLESASQFLKLEVFSVDDKSYLEDSNVNKTSLENGKLSFTSDIELKDSQEYHIVLAVKRIQNLKIDKYHCYRAQYLLKNMDVQIEYPEGLDLEFYSFGTLDNFKPMYKTDKGMRFTYEGLILYKQGYLITLHKQ